MLTKLLSSFALSTALAVGSAAAQDAASGPPAQTAVLVHGAFADGSSWAKVIPLLTAAGLQVVAVQNPLSSLAADVDATTRAIDQADGPVVLVGHSWGGVVITEAGGNPKVRSLVYVAAFAPAAGQSIASMTESFGPPPYAAELRRDDGGFLTFTADGVAQFFAPDLPAAEQALVTATQGPFHEATISTPVARAAWTEKPAWWVLSGDDRVIPAHLQKAMATTIGATATTVEGASHVVMLSHPETVAEVILAAAAGD